MNVLVACEESQAVTIELRKLGHNAFSCDILPCSGGHPEWHIQGDVLPLLNGSGDREEYFLHGGQQKPQAAEEVGHDYCTPAMHLSDHHRKPLV